MFLAQYVVQAVRVEGRPVKEVAEAHGITRAWVYVLLARYDAEGEAAFLPRSKAPHRRPHRASDELEDAIIAIRKRLEGQGLDAGPHTIAFHLPAELASTGIDAPVPSVSTIYRVLDRRGFINHQPQKRPKSSYTRFVADLPNECWQADSTHWQLADGTDVEILNIEDDHSRYQIGALVRRTMKALDVVDAFTEAFATHGIPLSVLTDNGAIFTATCRGGRTGLQVLTHTNGITLKHSRPYHPQTCGKVERFHQTQKKWLAKQRPVTTVAALQRQVARFQNLYNTARPHRAIGRRTPETAYNARTKAAPTKPARAVDDHYRVRHDVVYTNGAITLRHAGKLFHIGLGRRYAGQRIRIATAGLHVRITIKGTLIHELTLDPTRNYQPGPSRARSSSTMT
jgi:transposase InsO family protein